MLINKEYSHDRCLLHRTGLAVERHTLRREHESVWIVWYTILAACLMLFMASCSRTAWAEVYDSNDIADAIYQAEGGSRAVKPYGVLSVPCHSEADCRNVCLNTIENTFTRWQADGSKGDFLEVLAERYAPTQHATNDRGGLNVHWLGNVKYFLKKGWS